VNGHLGTIDSLATLPLQPALERTGVGLAACDAHGRLTLLSPVLQELFGVPFAPVAEEDFPRFFRLMAADGSTPLAAWDTPLGRSRRGEYVRDVLLTARRPGGPLKHLRCNAAPLADDDGDLQGAVLLVQDVTREQEAEHDKAEVQARIVETINHEFRTPLAALIGHLELIRDCGDRSDLSEELATSLDAIERAGWRLRDLVDAATELVEVGVRPHRH
jgi:signal transduction histidine kinase